MSSSRRLLGAVAIVAPLALWARGAGAQYAPLCRAPTGSNEERLLAFFSVPLTFSPDAPPRTAERVGTVRVSGELSQVPEPSSSLQRTTYCYQGTVSQTRLAPLFPRPRVSVALPAGLAVEASYVPPIAVGDARAHLGSLALSYARPVGGAWSRAAALTLGVRAHGTVGRVRGPVTCPESALQQGDPTAPCYGSAPSSDTFRPTVVGLDGALGVAPRGGRVAFYGGGGVTRLAPRFQVGFRDATGATDRTRVRVDNLTRGALFGGAALRLSGAAELAGQVYSVPSDATVWRVALGYRVR